MNIDRFTFLKENMEPNYKSHNFLTSLAESEVTNVSDVIVTKLYKNALEKYGKIDFGDIPNSKGDITALIEYPNMKASIQLMRTIKEQSGSKKFEELDIVETSLTYLESYKTEFTTAYKLDRDFGMMLYNTLAMSVLQATSFLMSVSVEFVKRQNADDYDVVIGDLSQIKSMDILMIKDLDKFNKLASSGDFNKIMNAVLAKTKLSEIAPLVIITGVIIAIGLATLIVPLIRELIYHFFNAKAGLSNYAQLQAEYLKANAAKIQLNSEIDPKKKRDILKKQDEVVRNLESLSHKLRIDIEVADKTAKKDLSNYKVSADDVKTDLSSADYNGSNSAGLV